MRRLLRFPLAAAILLIAALSSGRHTSVTHANPAQVWVINGHVAGAKLGLSVSAFYSALQTSAATRAGAGITPANLTSIAALGAGQVGQTNQAMIYGASVFVIVQSDGSNTSMTLNGRGLTCAPSCDGLTPTAPDAIDHLAVWSVLDAGLHNLGDAVVVSAVQDVVLLDSPTVTVVGQARDALLTIETNKTTLQEQAPSCGFTSSAGVPSRATAIVTYTDINGVQLAGYGPTLASSDYTRMRVGDGTGAGAASQALVSRFNPDGRVAAEDAVCGVAQGSATLSATTSPNEILGVSGSLTRTQTMTITGLPAAIALTASPALVTCDGLQASSVIAHVTDALGSDVVNGTPVNFSVVSAGTANPMNTTTTGGSASSTITPFAGAGAVAVVVSAGIAQASIRIDCQAPNPDFFAQAVDVTRLPMTVGISTLGATLELFEPQPCGNIGATVWLRYVVPPSPPGPATISVDTVGSYFNTVVAVYALASPGPPAVLTLIGCSASSTTSGVTFTITPGTTYYAQVGGQSGATGYLVANVSPDSDGDGLTDIQEIRIGTNPQNPDTDADGCGDGKELGLGLDALNPWDFFSVPVPALFAAPNPAIVFRDNIVGASDAQAVFAYFKLGAKTGTAVYEQDLNGNGIKDGVEYDRTVVGPGKSGAPDGVVGAQDAQLAFAQFKLGYRC